MTTTTSRRGAHEVVGLALVDVEAPDPPLLERGLQPRVEVRRAGRRRRPRRAVRARWATTSPGERRVVVEPPHDGQHAPAVRGSEAAIRARYGGGGRGTGADGGPPGGVRGPGPRPVTWVRSRRMGSRTQGPGSRSRRSTAERTRLDEMGCVGDRRVLRALARRHPVPRFAGRASHEARRDPRRRGSGRRTDRRLDLNEGIGRLARPEPSGRPEGRGPGRARQGARTPFPYPFRPCRTTSAKSGSRSSRASGPPECARTPTATRPPTRSRPRASRPRGSRGRRSASRAGS